MYCIKCEPRTGLIEVTIGGFWSLDQIDAFKVDLKRVIGSVLAAGKRHRMFYDYSEATIQSQEVVAALQAFVLTTETPALRIALFTGGRVARLQAARIAAVRDDMRLFEDRAAAMAWLCEGMAERRTRTAVGADRPGMPGNARPGVVTVLPTARVDPAKKGAGIAADPSVAGLRSAWR